MLRWTAGTWARAESSTCTGPPAGIALSPSSSQCICGSPFRATSYMTAPPPPKSPNLVSSHELTATERTRSTQLDTATADAAITERRSATDTYAHTPVVMHGDARDKHNRRDSFFSIDTGRKSAMTNTTTTASKSSSCSSVNTGAIHKHPCTYDAELLVQDMQRQQLQPRKSSAQEHRRRSSVDADTLSCTVSHTRMSDGDTVDKTTQHGVGKQRCLLESDAVNSTTKNNKNTNNRNTNDNDSTSTERRDRTSGADDVSVDCLSMYWPLNQNRRKRQRCAPPPYTRRHAHRSSARYTISTTSHYTSDNELACDAMADHRAANDAAMDTARCHAIREWYGDKGNLDSGHVGSALLDAAEGEESKQPACLATRQSTHREGIHISAETDRGRVATPQKVQPPQELLLRPPQPHCTSQFYVLQDIDRCSIDAAATGAGPAAIVSSCRTPVFAGMPQLTYEAASPYYTSAVEHDTHVDTNLVTHPMSRVAAAAPRAQGAQPRVRMMDDNHTDEKDNLLLDLPESLICPGNKLNERLNAGNDRDDAMVMRMGGSEFAFVDYPLLLGDEEIQQQRQKQQTVLPHAITAPNSTDYDYMPYLVNTENPGTCLGVTTSTSATAIAPSTNARTANKTCICSSMSNAMPHVSLAQVHISGANAFTGLPLRSVHSRNRLTQHTTQEQRWMELHDNVDDEKAMNNYLCVLPSAEHYKVDNAAPSPVASATFVCANAAAPMPDYCDTLKNDDGCVGAPPACMQSSDIAVEQTKNLYATVRSSSHLPHTFALMSHEHSNNNNNSNITHTLMNCLRSDANTVAHEYRSLLPQHISSHAQDAADVMDRYSRRSYQCRNKEDAYRMGHPIDRVVCNDGSRYRTDFSVLANVHNSCYVSDEFCNDRAFIDRNNSINNDIASNHYSNDRRRRTTAHATRYGEDDYHRSLMPRVAHLSQSHLSRKQFTGRAKHRRSYVTERCQIFREQCRRGDFAM